MPLFLTAQSIAQLLMSVVRSKKSRGTSRILFGLTLGLTIAAHGMPNRAIAASPETAPAELKQLLTQIDSAATGRNLQGVLQFYSPTFSHADGLNRQSFQQSLTQLWKQYPQLTYRTELKSWQPLGSAIEAETVTYITGTQTVNGQVMKLSSALEARQRIEDRKIVRQEILSENNQISTGDKPPTVKISLPSQVKPGQEFVFDAVVQEPLESDLLLGTALQEPVSPIGYLKTPKVDLDLLSSGGIFKVGRAPNTPGSQWISAVLVRHGGMTMVTQRMRIVAK